MSAAMNPAVSADTTSRTIAAFFAFQAGIGGVPGAAGAWVLIKMMSGEYGGAGPSLSGVLFGGALLGFIATGFALLVFYVRRAAGHQLRHESGWWRCSLVYNAVLLVASMTWGAWAPLGLIWFTALCALSWWAWRATQGDSDALA